MIDVKLKGKRYVALVRVSNASQGDTSAEAQLELLQAFGNEAGMKYVDQVDEIDITGSLPGKRKKLKDLLTRKKDQNDFDVALIQRMDRFTRSGSEHGFWLSHEFKRAGIKLVFVGDDIPEGRHGNIVKVVKYEAAFEQAFSISQRSTQGYQLALETGRCITSSHTPYACWRLYATPDKKPLHIIRDLRDGRQEKLDPKTHERIDTYGQIGGGSKGHFRKQKHELVLLIPGDKDHVAVVQEIFDLHFRQGWGGKRIASLLNKRGIPSPNGRRWSQRQVEVIYGQEAYTGRSIGNRTSSAIYHERNHSVPKLVELDEQVQATAVRIPKRERPLSEWFIQEQPLMQEFLDPELRGLAMAGHEEMWGRLYDPQRNRRVVPKRPASEYLLTGLLYAKQDGEQLTGVLCGRADKRTRYYRHRRNARGYEIGSIYNRMLPAQSLERTVLGIVQELLANMPDLERRIAAALKEQIKTSSMVGDNLKTYQDQRDAIRKRVQLIVSSFDEATLAEAQAEIDRLHQQGEHLEQRISQAEALHAVQAVDPAKVAEVVRERLNALCTNIAELPRQKIKQLLSSIVERIDADMETKAVEIHFALPSWMMQDALPQPMRLGTTLGSSASSQTHPLVGLKIAVAGCTYAIRASRACYDCRRRPAA